MHVQILAARCDLKTGRSLNVAPPGCPGAEGPRPAAGRAQPRARLKPPGRSGARAGVAAGTLQGLHRAARQGRRGAQPRGHGGGGEGAIYGRDFYAGELEGPAAEEARRRGRADRGRETARRDPDSPAARSRQWAVTVREWELRGRDCLLGLVWRRQSEASRFARSHLGTRLPAALTSLRRFTRSTSSLCTMLGAPSPCPFAQFRSSIGSLVASSSAKCPPNLPFSIAATNALYQFSATWVGGGQVDLVPASRQAASYSLNFFLGEK